LLQQRPSCGYAPLQRFEASQRIALLVRRSRGAHMRLRKSRAVRYSVRPTRRSAEASRLLSCGCAHYRVQPDTARQLTAALPPRGVAPRSVAPRDHRAPLLATLMEFPTPSTRKPRRVHSTPVCLTGYVPPTGFLTLSTVCSSPERPALFHAGNAHGVSLSRGFPSLPGSATHRLGITLMTFLHRTNESSMRGVRAPRAETRFSDLSASRALLRQ
jgi:hypothetical protein